MKIFRISGGKDILFNIEKRVYLKYLLFADLYFPEGVSNILVPVLTPLYLNSFDLPVETITLIVGLGWIPWIIKFLWSGFIDKYVLKGRRLFVFIGGFITIICLIILFFVNPSTYLIPFTIILFCSQVGQTILDSAADAWGIDVSTKENRGRINAAMRIGMVLGSGFGIVILAFIAEFFSYNYIFLFSAIFISINLILPTFIKETIKFVKKQNVLKLLFKEFKKKYVKLLFFYIPLASVGGGIFTFGLPLYASNVLGFSTGLIGITAGVGYIFQVIGSIIGGIFSDRKGRKKTIYIYTILTAFFVLLVIFSTSISYLIILYFIIMFVFAGFSVSILAFYMDAANPKIGGSHFSLYNGLANLGYITAGTATGSIIVVLGYNYIFILCGLLLFPPLLILRFIRINNQ